MERFFRGAQLLLLLIGLGLAGFGAFDIGRTWSKVAEARRWPSTEGTILNRDWRSVTSIGRSSSSRRFVPLIRYRYAVAGQFYQSEKVYPAGGEQWSTPAELQAYLDLEFPVGGRVAVSYDPAAPSRSAIILRGSYAMAATLLICGLVASFGAWAMAGAFRQPGESDARR